MMDMLDFFKESAKFMVADRPDIYNYDLAFQDLVEMHAKMQSYDGSTWTAFASYIFLKHVEDDAMVEWFLLRKLSSAALFFDEGVAQVFGHTASSGVLTTGIDLPDPSLDLGDEVC